MSEGALGLLEAELSQPACFDEGVEAARNACAAGASIAAGAITAAAYYDNPLTGLGALRGLMARLGDVPNELGRWRQALARGPHPETGDAEFTPGFGFVTPARAEQVLAACRRVALAGPASGRCAFLLEHHARIAEVADALNATGLAALAYLDAGVDLDAAERRWLGCKLEVAIAQAQKARRAGVAAFPFSFASYLYDGPLPPPPSLERLARERRDLERQLGLDGSDG